LRHNSIAHLKNRVALHHSAFTLDDRYATNSLNLQMEHKTSMSTIRIGTNDAILPMLRLYIDAFLDRSSAASFPERSRNISVEEKLYGT
jgi:hypothetical protein